MCMEVIICQSGRSPERLMISPTPSIGGTSNHLRWEKECGGSSPCFWGEFCKTLPTQNRIFLTFQNCAILNLPHFCICQYDKYSSKKLYIMYMGVEVVICQSQRSPERFMISQTPSIEGTSNHLRWEKECGGISPSFWGEYCKTLCTQNRIFTIFQNCGILNLPLFCICQYDK